MAEIGSGAGSSYPATKDTNNNLEVNSPNAGKTKARAEVVNDLAAAVVAIQNELGVNPAGSIADLVTYLQTEHSADGTHGAVTADSIEMQSGQIQQSRGVDVASASALPILTDGNFFDVTGTTDIDTISSVGVGTFISLQFDGILTINHDAADLILPGGLDIDTEAGDVYTFFEYASGDWIMIASSRTLIIGSVDTANIADGAITTVKLAEGAVTLEKVTGFWNRARVQRGSTTFTEIGNAVSSSATTAGTGATVSADDTTRTYILYSADNIGDYAYQNGGEDTQSSHNPIFRTKIKTDSSISDIRLFGGFFSGVTIRSDATPDEHAAFFRYDTDEDGTAFWRCVTIAGTGASAETTATTQSIAAGTVYNLRVESTATEHTFYINGTLVATHNSVVPTSTTTLDARLGTTSLSNTGSARGMNIHSIDLVL